MPRDICRPASPACVRRISTIRAHRRRRRLDRRHHPACARDRQVVCSGTVQPFAGDQRGFGPNTRVLAWLNADDRYVHGCAEPRGERFQTDRRSTSCIGDCDVIDDLGTRLLWRVVTRALRALNGCCDTAITLPTGRFSSAGASSDSWLLRRVVRVRHGLEFWLRLRDCRVEYVPGVLGEFCWRPSNTPRPNSAIGANCCGRYAVTEVVGRCRWRIRSRAC